MIVYGLMILMAGLFFAKVPIPNTPYAILNYFLRAFFHGNAYHLVVNMFTLWQLRVLSKLTSPAEFIKILIILQVVSSLLLYAVHTVIPQTKAITVGYSAVLFGLMVITQYLIKGKLASVSGSLLLEIIPQLTIPGISFTGHLSGIISGLLYILLNNKSISF